MIEGRPLAYLDNSRDHPETRRCDRRDESVLRTIQRERPPRRAPPRRRGHRGLRTCSSHTQGMVRCEGPQVGAHLRDDGIDQSRRTCLGACEPWARRCHLAQ